ncbi:MAG TPA: organomercurial lyase [Methylomirabilota bacterium]|nr:organomercurial lyase [Methylomirabilota bacterium]
MSFAIKTAAELIDPAFEARWARRRAGRETRILQGILRQFIEEPGPVAVDRIGQAFPEHTSDEIREALTRLDEEDLIQVGDGRVDLAYPFSALPTAFVVHLPGRGDRYACCAIDALGIAPMLGQAVGIRSRCHDCGERLELSAGPLGPGAGAEGVMVWVGKPCEGERRVSTSL